MLRRRSMRMRIIVLVLVPVVALIGLYAVALSLTLSSFLSLKQAADVRNEVTTPVTNVQLQLSTERGLALQYLADPTHAGLLRMLSQEPATDATIRTYLDTATKTGQSSGAGEQRASQRWATELGSLHALRATVVSVGLSRASAAASYSALIAGADIVLTQAVLPVLRTSALIQASDILNMEESLQAVAEERDLFAADLAAHSYPAADSRLVTQLIVQHRELWNQATPSLDDPYSGFFATDIPASTSGALTSLENQVLASPRRAMRLSLPSWTTVNSAYAAGFRKALYSASNAIRDTGFAQARGVLIQLLLIGGLGLIAIIAAIAIAVILSRALLQQLDDLRLSALDLSSVRLPAVLTRLRSGEDIDVGTETPQLDPGANEIGQLGRAFNIAAQAAVAAAVDEAEIRRGVNDVFRNLARRNQSLLTRQLELLDAMERRVHDPEELADLFRVDHLTTRMRRHAEGLLIVAGGSSGRVWREPVPIVDVMRAAVAEIEDYTRIRVTSRSSSSVAGHAVADIIHMLAELVENATTFSPANTPVRIESDNVAKGLIVEIEDRGLGMTDGQIEKINSKLNEPPLFDLSGSEQLGLFIAGQLAGRHEVKITMRGSAYGGITAVVLIPSTLIIDPGYDEPLTIVGLRELGGRPVPQLPAASLVEDATAGAESVATADPVSAVGYILDLESAAGTVRTTAAQIDTGEHRADLGDVQDDVGLDLLRRDAWRQPGVGAGLPGTGPRPAVHPEQVAGELVSADLAEEDAMPADLGTGDAAADSSGGGAVGGHPESAGLKGAGAWLAEADAATAQEPTGEPASSAGTPAHLTSPAPMLALGSQTDATDAPSTGTEPVSRRVTTPASGRATPLSPADDWASLLNQAASTAAPPAPPAESISRETAAGSRPAGHPVGWPVRAVDVQVSGGSVGWPDLPAASSGWLNLGGGHSGEASGPSDSDAHGNGSYGAQDDSSAPDHTLSLPKRQSRAPGGPGGRDLADTDSFGPVPSELSPADFDGLPVRVRQASIAPQLRDRKSTPQAEQYVAAPEMPAEQAVIAEPSPEAARSFMSALQRGWERGRSMAENMTDEPDDEQS
jgi:anti-sigma regulatory factor (Ser/Thr protein kinase)